MVLLPAGNYKGHNEIHVRTLGWWYDDYSANTNEHSLMGTRDSDDLWSEAFQCLPELAMDPSLSEGFASGEGEAAPHVWMVTLKRRARSKDLYAGNICKRWPWVLEAEDRGHETGKEENQHEMSYEGHCCGRGDLTPLEVAQRIVFWGTMDWGSY